MTACLSILWWGPGRSGLFLLPLRVVTYGGACHSALFHVLHCNNIIIPGEAWCCSGGGRWHSALCFHAHWSSATHLGLPHLLLKPYEHSIQELALTLDKTRFFLFSLQSYVDKRAIPPGQGRNAEHSSLPRHHSIEVATFRGGYTKSGDSVHLVLTLFLSTEVPGGAENSHCPRQGIHVMTQSPLTMAKFAIAARHRY